MQWIIALKRDMCTDKTSTSFAKSIMLKLFLSVCPSLVSTYIRLKVMFRAASFDGQFALLIACNSYVLSLLYYFFTFIWQIIYVLFYSV